MSEPDIVRSLAGLSPDRRALLLHLLQRDDAVAVIGLGCRFPGGADDPDRFWQLLVDGRDAVTPIPPARWDAEAYYDPDPRAPGKISSRFGAFLDRVDGFDAAFFGISPREALRMDPQQRLFLEVAWEALENAGQTMAGLAGSRTGVFAGVYQSDYSWAQFDDEANIDAYVASGMSHAILANRLSYFLDLRGPSLAIDTACSSSLVAFHLACESLRRRDTDLAIAAGVNLILSPLSALPISKWGMMSPDGRCKTFDARANGFVRGEGCGVLILKRLSDARRARDRVLAVCAGSAVNQDGRTNVLTAPNGLAQRQVIEQALANAGLQGSQIDYVEAHGTGTALGDPIEMEALCETVGRGRPPDRACRVGSVKTNIGHLEAAAGAAGLIKTVLALERQAIPPSLHFRELNPHISLDGTQIEIPIRNRPWPARDGDRRRAGVSSFGFGGTNAHVILEEAPPAESVQDTASDAMQLFVLSAPQAAALVDLARSCAARAAAWQSIGTPLADLCYSAARRRTEFAHRLAVVGRSVEDVAASLRAYAEGRPAPSAFAGRRVLGEPGVVFAYSGQGTYKTEAARALLESSAVFRQEIERCDPLFRSLIGGSLLEILRSEDAARGDETMVAQPVIFAIQMGLTSLWRAWGIRPAAVVGHSLGEITAACVAGALSLEQAATLVTARSRLMQPLAGLGKMVAVALPPDAVAPELAGYPGVSLAAVNSPVSCTISGEAEQIDALAARWQAREVRVSDIPVRYPFHSPPVAAAADSLRRTLDVRPGSTGLRFASTVTGSFVAGPELDARHWARNMADPVLFAPAIRQLIDAGHRTFLEVSPHPALSLNITQCLESSGQEGVVISSLRRGDAPDVALLSALGRLFAAGQSPDWAQVLGVPRRFVPLPTYPFQRKPYWIASTKGNRRPVRTIQRLHPLLDRRVRSPLLRDVTYETRMSAEWPVYQSDHRIHDLLVVPATAYLEMVAAARRLVASSDPFVLRDVVIRDALFVPDTAEITVQLVMSEANAAGAMPFQIFALGDDSGDWRAYAHGLICAEHGPDGSAFDISAVRARLEDELDGQTYYDRGRRFGGQLGPRFQAITRLWRRDGEVLGRLTTSHLQSPQDRGFLFHPAFADSLLHIAYAALADVELHTGILMPIGFDEVRYLRAPAEDAWCHFELTSQDRASVVGNTRLYADDGELLAEIKGVRFRRATASSMTRSRESDHAKPELYAVNWKPSGLRVRTRRDPDRSRAWLIFADAGGCGDALAARLRTLGERVVVIRPAPVETVERANHETYRANPLRPEHMRAIGDAAELGLTAERCEVLYLWGLDTSSDRSADGDVSMLIDVKNVSRVTQEALARLQSARLWLVTRMAQPATGVEHVNAVGTMLWGFGRTVALETPHIWGGLIDVDARDAEQTAAIIFNEVTGGEGESQVAWRGEDRLVARLARVTVDASGPAAAVDRDGVFLVTGGLGAIGRELARWLVDAGARHLVLVGRSQVSDADRTFLEALRQTGAEVAVRSADVGNAEEVTALCREAARQRPLKGIFHLAAVVADGALAQIPPERFEEVFTAKVAGTWNLHRATLDEPLDYFVMFSSAAAVLGSPGQSNYSAANAFLDGMAHLRKAEGRPALSINWGPWAIGMAAAAGEQGRRRLDAWGIGTLSRDDAVAIMPLLLAQRLPQLAVMPRRRQPRGLVPRHVTAPFFEALVHEPQVPDPAPDLAQQLERLPARRRKPFLTDRVVERVRHVLALPADHDIDPAQGLFDLGMDSLTAVELQESLRALTGLSLPATVAFDHPTLGDLTDHLLGALGSASEASAAAELAGAASDRLEELSETELVTLLDRELETTSGDN